MLFRNKRSRAIAPETVDHVRYVATVIMQLTHKHDLGIHTEMIGDGILTLVESGAVTNRRKNYLPGKMAATFALGSGKLYRFMDRNPALEIHPVDFTNDRALAGLNDKLIAINATLQIDLLGQCCSESLGFSPYAGTGGQSDFVRAANRSRGGKAFIVVPSTARNDTISRIVPTLSAGTHVSTSKNDINYVVTEYGVAQRRGKSAKQSALELIGIAHPDFRWISGGVDGAGWADEDSLRGIELAGVEGERQCWALPR